MMRCLMFFLLLLTAVSCQQKTMVQREESPLDFSGYCSLDWKRNGELEISAIFDIAKKEKNVRNRYYSIMSHLGSRSREKQYESFTGDIRLTLLDRSVCFMLSELYPAYVPVFSESRREAYCLDVLANIREYKALENSGLLSFKEKEEFEMLLLVTGTGMGTEMRSVSELFDYKTLPRYVGKGQKQTLPAWISWTNETPLLWAKLLMQLPQETLRAPGLNRKNVALCAMRISRTVAEYAVYDHMKKLHSVRIDDSDLRSLYRKERELSLAYAWQNRFPEPCGDFSQEEQFLSDIWQLIR